MRNSTPTITPALNVIKRCRSLCFSLPIMKGILAAARVIANMTNANTMIAVSLSMFRPFSDFIIKR